MLENKITQPALLKARHANLRASAVPLSYQSVVKQDKHVHLRGRKRYFGHFSCVRACIQTQCHRGYSSPHAIAQLHA